MTLQDVEDEIAKYLFQERKALDEVDFIIGISRGGLIPAVLLATKLDKPLITAYIDKQDNVYFDRTEWIKDKTVLVVDDVIRTGKTFNKIMELVKQFEPREARGYVPYTDKDHILKLPWDL